LETAAVLLKLPSPCKRCGCRTPPLTHLPPNRNPPPSLCTQVRYAGPEAWLCRPAPHVPELDGQEDTDGQGVVTHLPPRSHGGALARGGSAPASALAAPGTAAGAGAAAAVGGGDPLVAWSYGRSVAAARGPRRTSFRSIKEAVEAARDGDRIVLRRGQHNGMG
jgi:hypothetical protein